MLEHVPAWLGELLRERRAGHAKLVTADPALGRDTEHIDLTSPAFKHGGRLPIRFTEDGEGVSPPLSWSNLPAGTTRVALIVEDPDAPTPNPLVHAILWDIPASSGGIAEGDISRSAAAAVAGRIGRNSFLRQGWLPPDPPTGHGEHDYVFQLLALDDDPDLSDPPGRGDLIKAVEGHVLGAGILIGTYGR